MPLWKVPIPSENKVAEVEATDLRSAVSYLADTLNQNSVTRELYSWLANQETLGNELIERCEQHPGLRRLWMDPVRRAGVTAQIGLLQQRGGSVDEIEALVREQEQKVLSGG